MLYSLLADKQSADLASKAVHSADLCAQIASLAQLRMFAMVSGDLELSGVRYVCCAPRSTVDAVARNLGVVLARYLHSPEHA